MKPIKKPRTINDGIARRRWAAWVFALAAALVLWGAASGYNRRRGAREREAAAERRQAVQITLDVPYRTADNQSLSLDVYSPPNASGGGPFPVVLLLHGGGWEAGNKRELRDYARALALRGLCAVSADYRLVSRDGTHNLWPAQIDDVRAAVWFLRQPEQAARFHLFPHGRVGVMGHSSGAHLAALLGVQNARENGVGAVIDFAGPVDFSDDAHPPLSLSEMRLLPHLLGKTKAKAPGLYRSASPACLVRDRNAAPFLIFHGASDMVVPPQQARRMETALRQKHNTVRLILLPGEGHLFSKPESVRVWIDESARFFKQNLP